MTRFRTGLALLTATALASLAAAAPAIADNGEYGRPDTGPSGPQRSPSAKGAQSPGGITPGQTPTTPTPPPQQGGFPADGETPQQKTLYKDGQAGRYLLSGRWYRRMDPLDQGLALFFQNQVTLDSWDPIDGVPNVWNGDDESVESFNGTVAWYRYDFKVPKSDDKATWRFRFESANQRATVFLNGERIGGHDGPYVPFEVPAAKILRSHVNRLVVRVDNRRDAYDIPSGGNRGAGRFRGGWWNYGGLNREVYLRRVDGVDLQDLTARPQLDCRHCKAIVHLTGDIRNDGTHTRQARVRFRFGGQQVESGMVTMKPGQNGQVGQQVKIDHPKLWEPGDPNLYQVKGSVIWSQGKPKKDKNKREKKPQEHLGNIYNTHVGIRSLKVDKEGNLLLNGLKVHAFGAAMHEDDKQTGSALSSADRKRNFELLQQLHATITRVHYPLHPQTLEMADRAGMLVWDEVPFYVVPDKSLKRDTVRQKGLNYLTTTIDRDKNHPSVFAYSVSNELSEVQTPGQRRYLQDAAKLVHDQDPSRMAAVAVTGFPTTPRDPVFDHFDVIGLNCYYGWYNGPLNSTASRSALGPFLDQEHAFYPHTALFVTEFGAEANRSGPSTEKGTEQFQASWVRSTIKTLESKTYLNGAIAWALRDFRVRPNWDGGNPKPTPPVNYKGLVTQNGRQKAAFGEAAKRYAKIKPLTKVPKKQKVKKPKPPSPTPIPNPEPEQN